MDYDTNLPADVIDDYLLLKLDITVRVHVSTARIDDAYQNNPAQASIAQLRPAQQDSIAKQHSKTL